MSDYYLVRQARGPAWDDSRGRREQDGWEEHAAFMDALTEEGVVILGGPVGESLDDDVLVVMDAASEAAIRNRLADDPWIDSVLTIHRAALGAGSVRCGPDRSRPAGTPSSRTARRRARRPPPRAP